MKVISEVKGGQHGPVTAGPTYTGRVKRFSPLIILGAIAAFLLMRRRGGEQVEPDSAWSPIHPT